MSSGPTPAAPPDVPPQGLPVFAVEIAPPDVTPYAKGNTGIHGFTCIDSGLPGPHVVLVSLVHGNEFAGAIVLVELLAGGFPARARQTHAGLRQPYSLRKLRRTKSHRLALCGRGYEPRLG